MRDMKMLTLAVGSTAIGLTLMVMSVTRDVPLLRAVTAQHQQQAVMLQRSFAVAGGGGLVVDVADADVVINTGERRDAEGRRPPDRRTRVARAQRRARRRSGDDSVPIRCPRGHG
jgi:hypothetical protein